MSHGQHQNEDTNYYSYVWTGFIKPYQNIIRIILRQLYIFIWIKYICVETIKVLYNHKNQGVLQSRHKRHSYWRRKYQHQNEDTNYYSYVWTGFIKPYQNIIRHARFKSSRTPVQSYSLILLVWYHQAYQINTLKTLFIFLYCHTHCPYQYLWLLYPTCQVDYNPNL